MHKWCALALDYGIPEAEFWCMTFGEVERAVASKQKLEKIQAKERASYDYILADLIGRSISRIYSSANKMPEIHEAYHTLFDAEEINQKKKEKINELSALRFKLFADAHNAKYKGGE